MKKYIDAEKFKEKYLCCGYLPEMSEQEFDEFEAADVVSVVRCWDCKHFGHAIGEGKHACNNYQLPYCKPEDFCSYGDRKGDNEI